MGNAYELNTKNSDLNDVARIDAMNQRVSYKVVFFQLALGKACREMGTVDRNVEFLQDIRQGAQVIFVPVSKYYRSNVVPILFEEVKIRNADVYTVGIFLGESHASVKDQHFVSVTHSHAIHPELADTAERDNL
jgi:hypothetical protein